MEKFQPQQSFNSLNALTEKRVYNFTSVGAFTTVHTNKPTNTISIDQLMINDKLFKFKGKDLIDLGSDDGKDLEAIENEILLNIYSLKLFIEIGEDLKSLKKTNTDQEKLTVKLNSLKNHLRSLILNVIEGYQKIANQYALSVKIECKQAFFNLQEKLLYYRVKFESFIIEIDTIQQEDKLHVFEDFFDTLIAALIEFYVKFILFRLPS